MRIRPARNQQRELCGYLLEVCRLYLSMPRIYGFYAVEPLRLELFYKFQPLRRGQREPPRVGERGYAAAFFYDFERVLGRRSA